MATGTVAVVAGFFALVALDLLTIKHDLEAGRDRLDNLTLEAASSTGLTGLADGASRLLDRGATLAHTSLPLRALSLLPVFDDQIAGLRRMADVADELGDAGARAARRIDEQLEQASEPEGRMALIDIAMEELDNVAATLDRSDLGSTSGLLPPLRDAHNDLSRALRSAREKIEDGRDLITPVREMLEGPTELLLLAANNAEMTAGAGMTLSAGVIAFEGGDFVLGNVVRAGAFRLPSRIEIPENIFDLYRPTGVGIDLRSTTRSPDLATMGPIALDIVEQHGVTGLDGVIVLDAVALRDLMAITGPVDVQGETISAENVLAAILHDNYVAFDEAGGRSERVEYQGEIAQKIFEALTSGDVAGIDLAQALIGSAEGRHLILWSADPDLQDVWSELQVAGDLNEVGLMISFQNYGANKLDWYLRPTADLDVGVLPSGDYRASLHMEMAVPGLDELDDASPYIIGPSPEKHGVLLSVHLPEAAYDIVTPYERGFRTIGEEPPMQVRTFLEDVPLGTTFERTIEFSLPREVSAMLLLPSARLEPLPLEIDDAVTVTDDLPLAISWLAANPPAGGPGGVSLWVRIPALLGLMGSLGAAGLLAVAVWRTSGGRDPRRAGSRAAIVALAVLGCFVVAGAIAIVLALTGPRF